MIKVLIIQQRNNVLLKMTQLICINKSVILEANKLDVDAYLGNNLAVYDRLKVNDAKIEE